jgi:hypothetical protein
MLKTLRKFWSRAIGDPSAEDPVEVLASARQCVTAYSHCLELPYDKRLPSALPAPVDIIESCLVMCAAVDETDGKLAPDLLASYRVAYISLGQFTMSDEQRATVTSNVEMFRRMAGGVISTERLEGVAEMGPMSQDWDVSQAKRGAEFDARLQSAKQHVR